MGAMVTSTESVVVGHCGRLLANSCWVLSALDCKLGTGIFHGCAHIVLLLGTQSSYAMGVTIDLSNEHLIRFI